MGRNDAILRCEGRLGRKLFFIRQAAMDVGAPILALGDKRGLQQAKYALCPVFYVTSESKRIIMASIRCYRLFDWAAAGIMTIF